jgi:hypothetical protein
MCILMEHLMNCYCHLLLSLSHFSYPHILTFNLMFGTERPSALNLNV